MKPTSISFKIAFSLFAVSFAHVSVAQYAAPDKSGTKSLQGEIIKSIDANGHVLYSNRTIEGARPVETMTSRIFQPMPMPAPAPATGNALNTGATTPGPTGASGAAVKSGVSQDPSIKALNEANALIAKSNCANARQSLASLGGGPRLVRMTPDGKREELTADQIEADRAKARDVISRDCT